MFGHELLPEELGPHGQDVLVGREGAITGLKGHIVDAVHFIRLIQKAPEVLGEAGRRNDGDLIQAGLKIHGGHHCTVIIWVIENDHLEHTSQTYTQTVSSVTPE